MKSVSQRFQTQLSVEECSSLFQETAPHALFGNGIGGKLLRFSPGGNPKPSYFTPDFNSSGEDPAFAIGCEWKSAGGPLVAHMYVWDEDGRRIVMLHNPVGNGIPLRHFRKALLEQGATEL